MSVVHALLADTKKVRTSSDPFDQRSVQLNGLGHTGTFSVNIRTATGSAVRGIDGISVQ